MFKVITTKKLKNVCNLLLFCCCLNSAYAQEEKGCSHNYSALVLEADSGNILLDERADNIIYPASLTKLMTLYLTFEAIENKTLSFDQSLTISGYGEEISNVNRYNTLHLNEGDKITLQQAIQAVIVKSYNEAAVTLAEAVSGSEWEFVRKMNAKAQDLGMIRSSFRNSTGLHAEGQYTTTYDLARLTRALKKDFPDYYHLFSLKKFTYNGLVYKTHNHVLVDYKGAEGMKTGFTNASGYNLISVAKKGDTRLISVLVSCATYKKRDQYTKELLDAAFANLERKDTNHVMIGLNQKFDY